MLLIQMIDQLKIIIFFSGKNWYATRYYATEKFISCQKVFWVFFHTVWSYS